MCSQLREIYDKKSPIFLTEVGILVATITIMQYPLTCYQPLRTFYLVVVIVSGSQIIFKSIVLAIIHAFNRQTANTVQTILVVVYIICHLILWAYSIVLLKNSQFLEFCGKQEPHLFYVKIYVFMYAFVILGSFLLLLLLLVPVTALTIFSFKKKQPVNQD